VKQYEYGSHETRDHAQKRGGFLFPKDSSRKGRCCYEGGGDCVKKRNPSLEEQSRLWRTFVVAGKEILKVLPG